MQTRLLCAFALLCGAEMAQAQTWSNGYYQPYSTASGGYGSYGYGNYNNSAASPYGQASSGYRNSPDAANFYNRAFSAPSAPHQYYYPAWQGANAAPPTEENYPAPSSVTAASSPENDDVPPEPPCRSRFWLSANYAMMFIRPQRLNTPLLTVGDVGDANPGAIGQPNTTIISGDTLNFGMLSGVQADTGVFLDCDERVWLQWAGLYTNPGRVRYQVNSDATGTPLLAHPIFNANTGINQSIIDSFPGAVTGSFSLDAKTVLLGTETNLGYRCGSGEHGHADLLIGFRYLRLVEDLTLIDQFSPLIPGFLTFELGTVNPPNSMSDMDRFTTKNNFYGPQFGGQYAWQKERCFLSVFGKTAVGVTNQIVSINGSTQLIVPGGPSQFAGGGVFALPTNMGDRSRNVFGFVPEAGFTTGFKLTSHLQLTAGYSFLYWNDIVRPGGQLNATINPSQVPTTRGFGTAVGPAVPAFLFNPESFWVHTATCGFTLRF